MLLTQVFQQSQIKAYVLDLPFLRTQRSRLRLIWLQITPIRF